MTKLTAYHTTSEQNAKLIVKHGFRIPRNVSESSTDSMVGDFFPAIFFAHNARYSQYGNTLFKVQLNGKFMKLLPGRHGENMWTRLSRSISAARERGFDGVDAQYDTVGIAVVNPKTITIKDVKKV